MSRLEEMRIVSTENSIVRLKKVIARDSIIVSGIGLCALCDLTDMFKIHKGIIENWQYFSGSKSYPVPMSYHNNSESGAKFKFNSTFDEDMYDINTEYGQLRMHLANYLLEELTERVKAGKKNLAESKE